MQETEKPSTIENDDASPNAEGQAGDRREQRVRAAEKDLRKRRFFANARAFFFRHRSTITIAAVVLIVVYAAILRGAWVSGTRGNAGAEPSGPYSAAPNSQGRSDDGNGVARDGGGGGDASSDRSGTSHQNGSSGTSGTTRSNANGNGNGMNGNGNGTNANANANGANDAGAGSGGSGSGSGSGGAGSGGAGSGGGGGGH